MQQDTDLEDRPDIIWHIFGCDVVFAHTACPSPIRNLSSDRLFARMVCRVQQRLCLVLHPVVVHGADQGVVRRGSRLHSGMMVCLLDLRLPCGRALILQGRQLPATIQAACMSAEGVVSECMPHHKRSIWKHGTVNIATPVY